MQKLFRVRPEDEKLLSVATLGMNHEQQHQELMLTDIKHLFSRNPLLPAYKTGSCRIERRRRRRCTSSPFDGGIREIGASGKHFCFDNELPRHRTLVEPYALADRLVTNGEYLEFIRDGGYKPAGVLALGRLEHSRSAKAGRARSTGLKRSIANSRCTGCSR